jgi:hypothetical protein
MHNEILTAKQVKLLPIIKDFSNDFGLAGGTAIALQLGHRRSIDFDLFANRMFDNFEIRKNIIKSTKIQRIIKDEDGQYTVIVKGVRLTFLQYPFKIIFSEKFDSWIKNPDLLTLAATKAYALGRRAKWKDYVDLYFIIKNHHPIQEIIKKSKNIFKNEFNEKIFRSQLAYFKDIDYSEKIIYLKGFETRNEIIKKSLVDFSLTF